MLLLAACAGGDNAGTSFGGLSTANPTTPSGGTMDGTGSTDNTGGTMNATEGVEPTGGELDTGSPDPSITSGAAEATSDPAPNPDGLPNGEECTDPGQCMTDNCYKIPLPVDGLPPGICSVCDGDMDCVDAGLGTACTVDPVSLAAVCSYGDAGSFCETQAACQDDLFCTPLLPGAEALLPKTCSECQADADCGGGGLRCLAKIDVVMYSGMKYCAVPGSVGLGGLCPLPDGDPMCVTSKCALLNLAGLLDVGVCGECKADADCPNSPTKKCDPPKFDDGFIASKCI